ncbi:MAG: hypothetical protein K2O24_06695 [Muribaculaceae bacterium]|nr:hypothetical protein [Muribaculaceae bacterium]
MTAALSLLESRHSVRDYSLQPVSQEMVRSLQADLTMTCTHEAGLWFQMRTQDSDPFRGFLRSYGMFRNPTNYVACVIDPSYPDTIERAGYFAEQFVIKAVGMGLGTCFVGGTYSADHVNVPLRAGQRILMLVLFGVPAETPRALAGAISGLFKGKRKEPRWYFEGTDEEYADACRQFPWLETGLAGAACAPSWANGRPVRFAVKDGAVIARVDTKVEHNLIDLGIAKYNFAAAVGHGDWEWGNEAPFIP